MIWEIFFFVFTGILAVTLISCLVLLKKKYKRGRVMDAFKVLVAGVFLSSIIMFLPICMTMFQNEGYSLVKAILMSLHNSIRLFIIDADYTFIRDNLTSEVGWVHEPYTLMAAIIYVVAPILTFGFVLSFFQSFVERFRYLVRFFKETYVFSDLNEKSISLAKDLKKNNKKRMIVFTDVIEKNNETKFDLIEQAKEIGAILFKKDITTVSLRNHSKRKKLTFFAIGEDATLNIKQALALIKKYNHRDNTYLYVFSTSVDSEILLNTADKGKMKVRRVNEVVSLIHRTLYDEGERIYKSAQPIADGIKQISAVVVGMGQHGTEMTKALSWFCQMENYRLEINCFDKDKLAESKFKAICPELMDEKLNTGEFTEGDACYKINVHSDADVDGYEFIDALSKLSKVNYIFVALGNDEENIKTAINIRRIFARLNMMPEIDAVIYDSDKKKALEGISNFKKQNFRINFIGDLDTSYSEEVILRSDVEDVAFNRHKSYCAHKENEKERLEAEEDFWKYEYNYRSSIASAIHKKMKKKCWVLGIDKLPSERSEEELWNIRKLEHRRWNAYMRSEGYVYAEKRNDLAKAHNCITAFEKLDKKTQENDDD